MSKVTMPLNQYDAMNAKIAELKAELADKCTEVQELEAESISERDLVLKVFEFMYANKLEFCTLTKRHIYQALCIHLGIEA